jgi:hypothetical protein
MFFGKPDNVSFKTSSSDFFHDGEITTPSSRLLY